MPLPTKSEAAAIEGVVDKVQVRWKLRKANQKIENKRKITIGLGVLLTICLSCRRPLDLHTCNPRTGEGEAGRGSKVQGHPQVGSKLAADVFETPSGREDGEG